MKFSGNWGSWIWESCAAECLHLLMWVHSFYWCSADHTYLSDSLETLPSGLDTGGSSGPPTFLHILLHSGGCVLSSSLDGLPRASPHSSLASLFQRFSLHPFQAIHGLLDLSPGAAPALQVQIHLCQSLQAFHLPSPYLSALDLWSPRARKSVHPELEVREGLKTRS